MSSHSDQIRSARPDDVPELVRLRAVMFDAMGVPEEGPAWREICAERLRAGLAAGTVVGAVLDAPGGPGLASCVLAELHDRLPSPDDPDARHAYVLNVCTDPKWRRRGCARSVVSRLIDDLRALGATRIGLHATDDGLPLYESLGFRRRSVPELRWHEEAVE